MSGPRKCKVLRPHDEDILGTFHRFGEQQIYDDGGQMHTKTVAIVERNDGRVIEVEPHKIKFIE